MGEASEPRRRAQQQGCRGQSREILQRGLEPTSTHSLRGLSAPPPGRAGLGAEARVSVGSQGEDWGWWRDHSLKGASAPQLAGGSPGKGLELPKRQETFSCLFVSWCMRRGDSESCLNELQRWARATAISAHPTATGAQREKRRDSRMEAQRRQRSPAREACLLTRQGGRGLGAEARASVGSQGEDWGCRREHSLKGLGHHS